MIGTSGHTPSDSITHGAGLGGLVPPAQSDTLEGTPLTPDGFEAVRQHGLRRPRPSSGGIPRRLRNVPWAPFATSVELRAIRTCSWSRPMFRHALALNQPGRLSVARSSRYTSSARSSCRARPFNIVRGAPSPCVGPSRVVSTRTQGRSAVAAGRARPELTHPFISDISTPNNGPSTEPAAAQVPPVRPLGGPLAAPAPALPLLPYQFRLRP